LTKPHPSFDKVSKPPENNLDFIMFPVNLDRDSNPTWVAHRGIDNDNMLLVPETHYIFS